MEGSIVTTRLVVHVGGYDPMTPAAAHGRFMREARRFEGTWSVAARVSEASVGEDVAVWYVETAGANWSTRSEVRLLRWDDVMATAARQPTWRRVPEGLVALLDFVAGGALWGYLRWAWRYALFFLFPYVVIALLVAASWAVGGGLARLTGSGVAGAVAGMAAFAVLVAAVGRRLSLSHLLDDWIFARRYIRGGDPVLGARLDRVATALVDEARGRRFDEIVVLGHSLGAVLAVDLLDRAFEQAPELGDRARIVLVTVGSSIPKVGLHRAARRFRAALGRLADRSGLFWVEYQALSDAMNFYKTNPVRLLLGREGGPLVRIVRISRMLHRDYYNRIKRNFFRVHNQFVSANDLRAVYDYFMVVCGPLPVGAQARAQAGAEAGIAPDGALLGWRPDADTLPRPEDPRDAARS